MSGWVAGAIGVSSLIGASTARSGASQQSDAARQAGELSNAQFLQIREDQRPFREAGIRALPQLEAQQNMMPGAFTGQVNLGQDPGYAFRLSEGQKALDRSAAARGGMISGGALKAAQRFGQDLGSQEYQNAYNRALTGYNANVAREATGYNRLAALAGIGQTATSQIGAAGAANAANMGNYLTSGAAANAAGQMGQAKAVSGGLSTYLNYNQGNNLVNAIRGTTPGYSNAGNASQMTTPYGYSDQGFGQFAGDWTQGGTWAP